MRILVFSDIHGDLRTLERHIETEADYYFAAGDLVNWAKGFDRVGPILARRAEKMYVIPGNHESESDIARLCDSFGLINFHGKTVQAGRYTIAGLGYSNITPFQTPGEYSEQELAARLASFSGLKPLILICHCPPMGTALDRAREGMHFGSSAVKAFLEAETPERFFCGHIHEAEGARTKIGPTTAVNVGKRGFLLELD